MSLRDLADRVATIRCRKRVAMTPSELELPWLSRSAVQSPQRLQLVHAVTTGFPSVKGSVWLPGCCTGDLKT